MIQRFGAAVARWAHNPKVRGSKPRIAIYIYIYLLFQLNADSSVHKRNISESHSALAVPEWSPTSVLGKPNDA